MWWYLAGAIVFFGGLVDLLWTTLGTHGGGPISAPLTRLIWRFFCFFHKRTPRHRLMSFVGSIILFWLLTFWVFLAWLSWTLVLTGTQTGLVNAQTGQRADIWSRIFFVGATMFTSGSSEYVPRGAVWQIAATIIAASGLIVVTLVITYIMAVLAAVVEKRTLASYIWDLGGTPDRIIDRAWDGEKFVGLEYHIPQIMTAMQAYAEYHLAYPILHYFHAETRRTATPLRVSALYDTLLLIAEGTAERVRPPRLLISSARDTVRGLSEVLAEEFVEPADRAPARPDLNILVSRDIPTALQSDYEAAVDGESEVRRRLAGLVEEAGWKWSEVYSSNLTP